MTLYTNKAGLREVVAVEAGAWWLAQWAFTEGVWQMQRCNIRGVVVNPRQGVVNVQEADFATWMNSPNVRVVSTVPVKK